MLLLLLLLHHAAAAAMHCVPCAGVCQLQKVPTAGA
jgi:hypothetical protein